MTAKMGVFLLAIILFFMASSPTHSQTGAPEDTATSSAELSSPSPAPKLRIDPTQTGLDARSPFQKILDDQELGPVWPFNPVKYAIRSATYAGVPPNTIVLLLMLPVISAFIAAARHVVGLRGFGIFLPAALAVVFLAIGPILGIALFLLIALISTYSRVFLRRAKIRLQYLPRMALILWAVVIGVLWLLFLVPVLNIRQLTNVSIFPVLILVLLAEDFTKIQLGKSAHSAISQATETLILSLISFIFLTMKPLQNFALTKPEILLVSIALLDFAIGKYSGLRVVEYWRFRKLIKSK